MDMELWTSRQVAKATAVEMRTVYKWIRRREQVKFPMHEVQVGSMYLWDPAVIEEWARATNRWALPDPVPA